MYIDFSKSALLDIAELNYDEDSFLSKTMAAIEEVCEYEEHFKGIIPIFVDEKSLILKVNKKSDYLKIENVSDNFTIKKRAR